MEMRIKRKQMQEDVLSKTDTSIFGNNKSAYFAAKWEKLGTNLTRNFVCSDIYRQIID